MATTGNPHTPLRKPKRRRDAALANFGLGSDDEDFVTPPGVTRKARLRTPLAQQSPNIAGSSGGQNPRASRERFHGEHPDGSGPPVYVGSVRDLEQSKEEEEDGQTSDQRVSTLRGGRMSSPPPPREIGQEDDEPRSTCRGGKRQKLPWVKRLKKPITYDTDMNIDLEGHLSDLVQGVATQYDHQRIGQELNELGGEYAEGKSGHPLEERSLFTLTGRAGKAGLTTEHRLSIAAARSKPELGPLIGGIERSAPAGLKNDLVQVRMMPRSTGVGMTAHRDGIALSYDRVVFTIHTEYTAAPSQFFCKLMSTADARPDRGPYEKEQLEQEWNMGSMNLSKGRLQGLGAACVQEELVDVVMLSSQLDIVMNRSPKIGMGPNAHRHPCVSKVERWFMIHRASLGVECSAQCTGVASTKM